MAMQLYKITVVLDGTVDTFPRTRTYHVCARRGVVHAINRVLDQVSEFVVSHSEKKIINLNLEEIQGVLGTDDFPWIGEVDLGEAERRIMGGGR